MAVLLKKSVATVFLLGMVAIAILSLIGLIYLTETAFDSRKMTDGKYSGKLDQTQKNLAKMSVVMVWVLVMWILVGSFLQKIWE